MSSNQRDEDDSNTDEYEETINDGLEENNDRQPSNAAPNPEVPAELEVREGCPARKRRRSSTSESSLTTEESSSSDEDEEFVGPFIRHRRGSDSNELSDSDESDRKNYVSAVMRSYSKKKQNTSASEMPSTGSKNIQTKREKIMHVSLTSSTRDAVEADKEKTLRMKQRREMFNIEDVDERNPRRLESLVLDYNSQRAPIVSVDTGLLGVLQPHQANGVRFMWEVCFESVERIAAKDKGHGCILAHCMGLGKTLQVVTLVHTLLSHPSTGVKRVLVLCPKSTALNWRNEFRRWLARADQHRDITLYEVSGLQSMPSRLTRLQGWIRTGGVFVLGYEMFRNLASLVGTRRDTNKIVNQALYSPGPDLLVCDEGHLIKNEEAQISQAARLVRTRRRIMLTGTPLQNNLTEYYCMVNFVKENLLGDEDEYKFRFAHPIINGQFVDSNDDEIQEMKRRSHVLHKLLEQTVQRKDCSLLSTFLPPKFEYVLNITITRLQGELYDYYLDNYAKRFDTMKRSLNVLRDFPALLRVYNHPLTLKYYKNKEKSNRKKKKETGDDIKSAVPLSWYKGVTQNSLADVRLSNKLVVLFDILRRCRIAEEKLLVFSQSLYTLDVIEFFLKQANEAFNEGRIRPKLNNYSDRWVRNEDYLRLDGGSSALDREASCVRFNDSNNHAARLFLISTRAGSLGINLTGANRVVLFDVSWNPSYDVQSIFRAYRIGQQRPCYVYRFIAMGTMEQKIYYRQVTKLAVAKRVVDEEQVQRHYTEEELVEMYQLEPSPGPRPTPAVPSDHMLAELLRDHQCIHEYHVHDSLLADIEEERLSEAERAEAWRQFERERAAEQAEASSLDPIDALLSDGSI